MSDETTTPEVAAPEAPTPDIPEVETVFFIVKRKDGSHYATVNLSTKLNASRQATTLDIKHGCADILDVVRHNEVANLILGQIAQNSASESDKVSSSIRQALADKGIL